MRKTFRIPFPFAFAITLLIACNSNKPASQGSTSGTKDSTAGAVDSGAGSTAGTADSAAGSISPAGDSLAEQLYAAMEGQGGHPTMHPNPKVMADLCSDGPGAALVTALKDRTGHIGAYVYRRAIRDTPISYLDPQGRQVAMFHIFGPPEEKKRNAPLIDSLRAAFPVEEDVPCSAAKAPGAP